MVSKKSALISRFALEIWWIESTLFNGMRIKPSNNGSNPLCIIGFAEAEIVAIDLP